MGLPLEQEACTIAVHSLRTSSAASGERTAGSGTDRPSALAAFRLQRASLFYPKSDLTYCTTNLPCPSGPEGEELLRFLSRACEEVLGDPPLEIRPLAETGTFHWLFRARWSAGSVILRVSARPGERDYPLLLDPWVMGHLRSAGLPALRVFHVDLSRRLGPWDYAILEEARGVPCRAFDDDETRTLKVLRELGSVAARVHRIATAGYGLLCPQEETDSPEGVLSSWQMYLSRNLEDHLQGCLDSGAIDSQEAGRIRMLFDAPLDQRLRHQPVLLHGDLGSHNVFADGTSITAVIDWEDSLSGDPVYDIAFWATFHPERRHAAFLEGYRSIRPLPGDFDSRFWLYFLRVALAKTVLRQRLGLTDRPGRLPASQRIQLGLARAEGQRRAA